MGGIIWVGTLRRGYGWPWLDILNHFFYLTISISSFLLFTFHFLPFNHSFVFKTHPLQLRSSPLFLPVYTSDLLSLNLSFISHQTLHLHLPAPYLLLPPPPIFSPVCFRTLRSFTKSPLFLFAPITLVLTTMHPCIHPCINNPLHTFPRLPYTAHPLRPSLTSSSKNLHTHIPASASA